MNDELMVTASVTVPAGCLSWTAVRASGPGGQNVNKVSTSVELRCDLSAWPGLPDAARARLRQLAGARLTSDDVIVLQCQTTRSQAQNLAAARARLAALIERALVEPKRRRPTRPTRGAVEARLQTKRRQAERKSQRRGSDE